MEGAPNLMNKSTALRAMTALWFAMSVPVVIYVVMGMVLRRGEAPLVGEAVVQLLFRVSVLLSVLLFALQFFLRSQLSDEKMFPRLGRPGNLSTGSERLRQMASLSVGERGEALMLQARLALGLVSWMMANVIGLFGLTVAFLSSEPNYALLFGGLALLDLAYFYPRRSEVEQQLENWRRQLASRGME